MANGRDACSAPVPRRKETLSNSGTKAVLSQPVLLIPDFYGHDLGKKTAVSHPAQMTCKPINLGHCVSFPQRPVVLPVWRAGPPALTASHPLSLVWALRLSALRPHGTLPTPGSSTCPPLASVPPSEVFPWGSGPRLGTLSCLGDKWGLTGLALHIPVWAGF